MHIQGALSWIIQADIFWVETSTSPYSNHFSVPTTLDEYCIKTQISQPVESDEDNFDWDPYDDVDDDDDEMCSEED